jgi:hypothetical protein
VGRGSGGRSLDPSPRIDRLQRDHRDGLQMQAVAMFSRWVLEG